MTGTARPRGFSPGILPAGTQRCGSSGIMTPDRTGTGPEDPGLHTPKRWQLLPHDRVGIERLSSALNVSPALAQLLFNRGLREPDAALRFLQVRRDGLHDPALLPGAEEAARRIYRAVRDGKRICVYGDYDVDGTTGT